MRPARESNVAAAIAGAAVSGDRRPGLPGPFRTRSRNPVHGTSLPQALPEDFRRHLRRGGGGDAVGAAVARGRGGDRRPTRHRHHDTDLLRNVLLALRRHRPRARRQAVEVRRQPEGPAEPRPAVPARHRRRRRVLRPRPIAQAAHPPRRARQGGVDGGDLGRGVHLHRRADGEDQGAARARGGRRLPARDRAALHRSHAQVVGCDQLRRPVVRAVPRRAGRRFHADLRQRHRLARADRHREHRVPGADRHAPRREHAQPAGAGVRQRRRAAHPDHRRRPAVLGRRQQGEVLAAGEARHRPRAAAGVVQPPGQRGPLRPGLRRQARPRLRPVRRRDQGPHARVGGGGNGRGRRADPRGGARVLEPPAGRAGPPGAPRQLERRRHAAQPRGGAALGAAGQLGREGRAVPVGRDEGRAVSAAQVPEIGQSRSPTTPTASAGRSPTKPSPPDCATRRSPASRTRSRAGSSIRPTS